METQHRGRAPVIAVAAAAAGFALAALAGCDPEVPQRDAPPDRVEVIFDAEAEILPTPNDAAMQEGRLPGISGAEEGTAEGELSDYMGRLTGWPRTIPVEIPFSGPLDEETIDADTVRLYRIEGDAGLARVDVADYDYRELEDRTVVEIIPDEPPSAGEQYAGVVTRDLYGAEGHRVGAPLAAYLAGARQPLVDDDGEPTMAALADEPETARQLEEMRQLLSPVYEALGDGVGDDDPVDRDDTAMVFRWTTMPEVAAAFFPDFQQLPLPNTAALDEDGTFPDSALCNIGEESAEGVLDEYLAGLSGWPDETPITLRLTAAIDEGSIGEDDVQLWRNRGDGWERDDDIEVGYRQTDVDECSGEEFDAHIIDVVPEEPMSSHEEYFAFATREIESADGEAALQPEMPLALALQPHPLVDDDGASVVSVLDDGQAGQLEEVRRSLEPAIEVIGDQTGMAWDELGAVWSWYTWDDTFASFDPATGEVPFPNSALMDADEEFVQIPIAEDEGGLRADLIEALNGRPGFSPTAPGWIPLDGQLDEEDSDIEAVNFMNIDSLSILDDGDIDIEYDAEASQIGFEAVDALGAGDEYVGVVTDELVGTNDRTVQPSPFITLLLGGEPVAEENDDGQMVSLVEMLDDEDAAELEESRLDFEDQLPVLGPFMFDDWGDEDGTNRENILAVWTFEPEEPVEGGRQWRARVDEELPEGAMAVGDADVLEFRRACEEEGDCSDDPDLLELADELDHPREPGVTVETSHIRAIHTGAEFDTVDAELDEEVAGVTVAIPDVDAGGDSCEPPFDVVVAGHGFGADRWQSTLAVADEVAAEDCLATVAPDFPGHGGRTAGVDELHPEALPAESGEEFWTGDFAASKANFNSAFADLIAVTKIAEANLLADDGEGVESTADVLFEGVDVESPVIDEVVGYTGIGLGGIVGVVFAATNPQVEVMALHGAGGRLDRIIEGDEEGLSEIGEPIAAMLEEELEASYGDAATSQVMALGQWLFDYIDPVHFAERAVEGDEPTLSYSEPAGEYMPTTGSACDDGDDCDEGWRCEEVDDEDVCVEYLPETDAMVQMAEGDRVVVNATTELLADALGVSLEETTFQEVDHAFIEIHDEDHQDYGAGVCARRQVGGWTSAEGSLPAELSAQQCLQN